LNSENFNEKYGIASTPDVPASGEAVRSAPPTVRGEVERPTTWVDQAKLRVWPGVLGGIAVVFGFGGVIASLAGLAVMTLSATVGTQHYEMSVMPTWYSVVTTLAHVGLGVALGVAGVGLLMKRGWGAWLGRRWAAVKLAVVAGTWLLSLAITGDTLMGLLSTGGGLPGGAGSTAFFMSLTMFALWTLWLPVFMLYWLNKKSVKDDIAGWTKVASSMRGSQT